MSKLKQYLNRLKQQYNQNQELTELDSLQHNESFKSKSVKVYNSKKVKTVKELEEFYR